MQHHGTATDEKDVYRLVSASESFMRDFCTQAFGIDYGKLSVLDDIGNDSIRRTLQEALDARERGSYEEAAIAAHLAIQKTKYIVQDKILPHRFRHSIGLQEKRVLRDISEVVDELRDDLDDTLDVALSAHFAYDLKRLTKMTGATFRRTRDAEIAARVVYQKLAEDDLKHALTLDDADFAIELATEYILWAQQNYGL